MGMYGSRLREPIRVPYEPEPTQSEQPQQHHQQQQKEQDHLQQQNQQLLDHHQQQQQQEQQKQNEEQKQNNYEYYTYTQKEVPHQTYTTDDEQAPQQAYEQYPSRPTSENDAKQQLEEHLQAQLQEQIQQAQQLVKDREQKPPQAEQNEADESPAPVYEKDPVTRSYNIYEEHTEGYDPAQQSVVDRNYRTKFIYKPAPQYQENANENEERIRVSASTEIPKAEIMKQIEKSVIKYMKELEAEGKIIAAPQNQEPKTYFKVITVPGSDEKRIASTTIKPTKYISSSSGSYQEPYKYLASQAISSTQKYHKNAPPKSNYQNENESAYQTAAHDVAELTPNVEFIYKIKTKAPLHTATVKTVSKPYNLPIKSYEQFDHSQALKNLEEFDLSHVVTTPDPEEHQIASTNKPNKLYFNSEIYHDINSLPYKQKQRAEAEFRKLKAAAENHPDYKGYAASNSQGGYYAEPPSDREPDRETSSSNVSEDGYPIMNPYQHVLKKEAMPGKYDDSSYEQQQPRSHKYKPLEFDSYNPKFNNNPEGYGYQQTYKTHLTNRHAPGKRGKRGGSPHPSANKKSTHRASLKDYEANVALRPPPKN
ncbi:basic-leucine zipper transcription factor A [Calliphora vicina]|uniref:basic-leucine zipper transcription factor A n=1 Tax=Calliphora vicina TaxID=7373 RepID=UPI00325AAF08